jgi:hypothetical protein
LIYYAHRVKGVNQEKETKVMDVNQEKETVLNG